MQRSGKKQYQIVVNETNYRSLQVLGHVPETFNDVITRLLEENKRFQQEVKTT